MNNADDRLFHTIIIKKDEELVKVAASLRGIADTFEEQFKRRRTSASSSSIALCVIGRVIPLIYRFYQDYLLS